ncbi:MULTISPECIES: GLPGLI family protein [unclassified Polaribacter]|uniref:GLPGLI family protein n=1 Tax=unclassified Polaribacter TaxID=196858 RepID=UPI00140BB433|nr:MULTISPECIES: GLPGLI family protein [unclassified Polaribacter]
MNKKYINLLIFLFLNVIVFHSQNIEGRITYLASAKKALAYIQEKGKKNKKHIRKHVNELYKKAKDVKVILNFNSVASEYHAIKKMDLTNKEEFNFTYLMSGSSKKYYTSNNVMSYENNTLDCYLLGECFLIQNLMPIWELKQETKKIGGFLCYKAVLRNKKTEKITLEAWYTPKIPYSYGVMNYFGLPGVILEISKNTIVITAIKIELNPIGKIIIKEPKKIKKLSRKEFDILKRTSFSEFYKKR